MEQKMEQTKKKSVRDIVTVLLFTTGVFCWLGAAGNSDLTDEMNSENKRLGYEKYTKEDMPSEKATRNAIILGTLAFAGGAGLYLTKKKQENQR